MIREDAILSPRDWPELIADYVGSTVIDVMALGSEPTQVPANFNTVTGPIVARVPGPAPGIGSPTIDEYDSRHWPMSSTSYSANASLWMGTAPEYMPGQGVAYETFKRKPGEPFTITPWERDTFITATVNLQGPGPNETDPIVGADANTAIGIGLGRPQVPVFSGLPGASPYESFVLLYMRPWDRKFHLYVSPGLQGGSLAVPLAGVDAVQEGYGYSFAIDYRPTQGFVKAYINNVLGATVSDVAMLPKLPSANWASLPNASRAWRWCIGGLFCGGANPESVSHFGGGIAYLQARVKY